jgi:opacity protein-like surface antigen
MRQVLFLLMMIPAIVFCQEKKSRRLTSVGVMISPEFSYRTLNFSSSNQWVADRRDSKEMGNFGFTTGIQTHFRFGNRLSLETGLSYANKSLKTKSEELTWTSDDPDLPTGSRTIYRYKYLAIPAIVSYRFFDTGKISWFAAAGISANVFLAKKTKVVTTYPDGDSDSHASSKQTGYSKFNLSATLAAGMDYRFSKRFTFRAEPFFQRSLTSIVSDKEAKEYLFSFGVSTGVQYSL